MVLVEFTEKCYSNLVCCCSVNYELGWPWCVYLIILVCSLTHEGINVIEKELLEKLTQVVPVAKLGSKFTYLVIIISNFLHLWIICKSYTIFIKTYEMKFSQIWMNFLWNHCLIHIMYLPFFVLKPFSKFHGPMWILFHLSSGYSSY